MSIGGTMKRFWIAPILVAGSMMSATVPAFADIPSVEAYAEAQCGNGAFADKNYPDYESCYSAAVEYYYEQVGGGGGGGGGGVGGDAGGGGGGGGGGGSTFLGDIPGYTGGGCVSRLCNPGPTNP